MRSPFAIAPLLDKGVQYDPYTLVLIAKIREDRYWPDLWNCNSNYLNYEERVAVPADQQRVCLKSKHKLTAEQVREYREAVTAEAARIRADPAYIARQAERKAREEARQAERAAWAEERRRWEDEVRRRRDAEIEEQQRRDKEWTEAEERRVEQIRIEIEQARREAMIKEQLRRSKEWAEAGSGRVLQRRCIECDHLIADVEFDRWYCKSCLAGFDG